MLKVNAKTSEIFIYDVIGQDVFGEGITAASISDALTQLGGQRAKVRLNSPGGAANEGIAIYNLLKRYEGGVDTYNDSIAASAASIIFLAGENRYAAKGARVMIHKAWTVAMGNSASMRQTIENLEKFDQAQAEIIAPYLKTSEDEVLKLLEAETWYGAKESVAAGLATAQQGEAAHPKMAAWFRNAPSDLVTSSLQRDLRRSIAARLV